MDGDDEMDIGGSGRARWVWDEKHDYCLLFLGVRYVCVLEV
jgi:hypothetical protein